MLGDGIMALLGVFNNKWKFESLNLKCKAFVRRSDKQFDVGAQLGDFN